MNFKRVTILTLSRDNAETIGVGWHCFEFWNAFVIATEKIIVMKQEAFSFVRAKTKSSRFLYSRADRFDGQTVKANQKPKLFLTLSSV